MSEKQYRLLNVGEVIREGDEVLCEGHWSTFLAGIGQTMGDDWAPRRRPIAPTDDLRRQLDECQAMLVAAREERDRVRAQRDDFRAIRDAIMRDRDEAIKRWDAARASEKSLAESNEKLSAKLAGVEADLFVAHEQCKVAKNDRDYWSKRYDEINAEVGRLREENAALKAKAIAAASESGKSDHVETVTNVPDQQYSRHILDTYASAHQPAEASPRERIVATLACGLIASGSEFNAKDVVRKADELIKEMSK